MMIINNLSVIVAIKIGSTKKKCIKEIKLSGEKKGPLTVIQGNIF